MAGRYKQYPEYRSSDIEWLGEIPTTWKLSRLKFMAKIKNGQDHKSVEADEGYPVIGSGGQFTYASQFTYDQESVLLGRKGTIDRPLYINEPFWTVDTMYYTVISKDILPKYLYYLALTIQFGRYSTNTALPSMTQEHLGNYIFATPKDKSDQDTIANFLDHETAKIDTLIKKQQHLIQLLKEKRQAVISHAVTKGLNPNAKMRDSGIEWLGEVPEHWRVLSLGKITVSKCDGPFGSGLKSEHYSEFGVRVIRLQNIKIDGYYEGEGAFIDEKYYKNNLSNHDVIAGDLLIAGLGDPNNPVGRACVAPNDISPAMVKADCFRFRLDGEKALPAFVARQLSFSAWSDAGKLSNGSTRARIPLSLMATRIVAICPMNEQAKILEHIETLVENYDKLEQKAIDASLLLGERRTALISAAVTGKIDVRNWVAPKESQTHQEVAA